jgi:D-inositol-3-phosphate glycosyltransferase
MAAVGTEHAGGMNIYVRKLADELSTLGAAVDVFTRRTSPADPELAQLSSGARLIHLTAGPPKPLPKSVLPLHIPSTVQAFRNFCYRSGREYDVLHSHYWLSGFVAARCRPDSSLPLIHMFHTLSLVKELHSSAPDPRDSALRRDGERCVIGSADVVVGATSEEEDYMKRLYGRGPRRFEVIPPGVDVDLFRPRNKQVSRRALGIGPGRVVLFVGRPDKIKGLDVLLTSIAELRGRLPGPLHLVLVGSAADRRGRHRLHPAISRLGLDDLTDVRGTVPHEELAQYYSAADVVAMPSAYESFGMAALEAMACETPVVAFRVGGLAETIRHGLTGFLATPGNREDFTRCLERALLHPDTARIGRQARLAAHGFQWRNVAAQTLELYDDVLRRQRFASSRVAGR